MKAVILAGGIGTRLWPLSRRDRPKQFLPLLTQEPLIKDTYHRLLRLFSAEEIFFSVSPAFAPLMHTIFPEVPETHIIVEPLKRDTGPAMGYVAALLELSSPDEPVVFVPSDHYIRDEERFLTCLRVEGELVEQTGNLLDIGISAEFPSTILGYTRVGNKHDVVDGVEIYHFAGHTEKPDYETAKRYLEDGSYLWHANYFCWTPRKFMEAFDRYASDVGEVLRAIQLAWRAGDQQGAQALFASIPSISFDYAVAERMDADDVLIVKGDFGWSDIGGWDTLYAQLAAAEGKANVHKGADVLFMDADRNLVYAPQEKLVTLLGVEDLVVVDTEDALLITRPVHAGRIKELLRRIEEEKGSRWL